MGGGVAPHEEGRWLSGGCILHAWEVEVPRVFCEGGGPELWLGESRMETRTEKKRPTVLSEGAPAPFALPDWTNDGVHPGPF